MDIMGLLLEKRTLSGQRKNDREAASRRYAIRTPRSAWSIRTTAYSLYRHRRRKRTTGDKKVAGVAFDDDKGIAGGRLEPNAAVRFAALVAARRRGACSYVVRLPDSSRPLLEMCRV
jgi:hypothetical protein